MSDYKEELKYWREEMDKYLLNEPAKDAESYADWLSDMNEIAFKILAYETALYEEWKKLK